ncbi:MAG: hypothetical protein LC808_39015 [Actinobacteria bacterium]|nr:hypothetical protein [Actinomycetota bacterium]
MGRVAARAEHPSHGTGTGAGREVRETPSLPPTRVKAPRPVSAPSSLVRVNSFCSEAVCPCITPQSLSLREGVSPLPDVPVLQSESHPFAWFPLAGQRHAIDRRDRNVPIGSPMRCLCSVTHPRGADGDIDWLWPTCERCWDEACRIVGVRRGG